MKKLIPTALLSLFLTSPLVHGECRPMVPSMHPYLLAWNSHADELDRAIERGRMDQREMEMQLDRSMWEMRMQRENAERQEQLEEMERELQRRLNELQKREAL
jgi:TolA-binding protein